MSTTYEQSCDFCGLVTKRKDDPSNQTDVGYVKNDWDVNVSNHYWADEKEGDLKELINKNEFRCDACFECAKAVAGIIKDYRLARLAETGK